MQAHADARLPVITELHFLDRGIRERSATRRLAAMEARSAKGGNVDAADLTFLRQYVQGPLVPELVRIEAAFDARKLAPVTRQGPYMTAFVPEARHFEHYEALFAPYRPAYTGDVTPAYWLANPDAIAATHARYPHLRYVMMVRNPVERYISTLNKAVHKGNLSPKEAKAYAEDPAGFRRTARSFFETYLLGKSIHEAYARWAGIVGADRIKVIFFDDLIAEPDATRRTLLAFLGLDPDPRAVAIEPDRNRKKGRIRKTLDAVDPAPIRDAFAADIAAMATTFGGAALTW